MRFLLALFATLAVFSSGLAAATPLEDEFRDPPQSAKPWVFWYWMQANATREGITRDLEAMAETGVGGAILMSIGEAGDNTLAKPPANPLSDHWWQLVIHANKEARRLNLRLAMNACDGWALAGGPWITPESSMQEITATELTIDGGKPFHGKLPQPTTRENHYRDIAVFAWPKETGHGVTSTHLNPKATTNIPGLNPQPLVKGANAPLTFSSEGWIQYEFDKPFTCRSIRMTRSQGRAFQTHRAEILVSDDGKTFRSLGRLKPSQFHGWQDRGMGATHSIEPTTARFFRFVIDKSDTPPLFDSCEGTKTRHRKRLTARHIEFSSRPRLHQWEGKAGFRWRRSRWTSQLECPDHLCVNPDNIIDLTTKLKPDGTLQWSPPAGQWTVQRIGYTTTGETNNPAGTGSGLECDKFNPDAAVTQFNGWFGQALDRVGPSLAGNTLWRNHTDSWEAGSQNWSPRFRSEFTKRRGYDPLPWLPTMTGVPIQSVEHSERFLYDVRRTIADLVCENFYAPLTEAGRKRGTEFTAENIAPTMMADGLQHFKYTDMPMGEFWLNSVNQDKPNDISDAISAGHIYGKKVIGAEAFTQNPITWDVDPYYLKPLGDHHFAQGINRFVLHVWAHQAFDQQPGVTLNSVGTFFSVTQTWHKPGKAWFDYISRSSAMLQSGLPVSDVCYFIGEEQPSRSFLRRKLPIPLPDGYSFDSINRDALLTRASAKNGKLVLPDGVSYRALVLPPGNRMSPELATKIGALASAGVPVIGPHPTKSISLENYPQCDQQVRSIVESSWQSVQQTSNAETLLKSLNTPADVEFIGADMTPVYREKMQYHSPPFTWSHRRNGNTDIYFLSNQERQTRRIDVAFRDTGRVPELWNAESAKIRDAGIWRERDGRTIVTMTLPPAGSIFVVFRRPSARTNPITHLTRKNNKPATDIAPLWIEGDHAWASQNGHWTITRQSGDSSRISVTNHPTPLAITGPWHVGFPPKLGAPNHITLPRLQPLNQHSNAGIKHFSGTATYTASFKLTDKTPDQRVLLNLGHVANLADVSLNGKNLGILWKPPFVIEVTSAIRTGDNKLSIKVTNNWHNRLVGDAQLPPTKRITWTWAKSSWFDGPTPLVPSGLIGPVTLSKAQAIRIK